MIGVDTFMQEDTSIASQVTRYKDAAAKNGEADVMMVCSYVPGAAAAIRQIRAAGIKAPIIGGDSMDGDFWVKGIPNLSDHYAVTFGSKYGDDRLDLLAEDAALGVVLLDRHHRAVERWAVIGVHPAALRDGEAEGDRVLRHRHARQCDRHCDGRDR